MDPYRHRQLLHDRWINRASQRLGDIATLKYGSIKEFFRVSAMHVVRLDPVRCRQPPLYETTPTRCPTHVLVKPAKLRRQPQHAPAKSGKGGKYTFVLHNVLLEYCTLWALVYHDVPSDGLHRLHPSCSLQHQNTNLAHTRCRLSCCYHNHLDHPTPVLTDSGNGR